MNATNSNQESKGFYKLNWVQRIGFGSGDLAQNLIFQVICTYLLFFYTDIYGLTPSAVAVMFLVGNVANVIWDPIVGALIDKSNPRYGKYRSYLLYVGIPLSGFALGPSQSLRLRVPPATCAGAYGSITGTSGQSSPA